MIFHGSIFLNIKLEPTTTSSPRRRGRGLHNPDSSHDQIQCFWLAKVRNFTNVMIECATHPVRVVVYLKTPDHSLYIIQLILWGYYQQKIIDWSYSYFLFFFPLYRILPTWISFEYFAWWHHLTRITEHYYLFSITYMFYKFSPTIRYLNITHYF